MGCCEELPQDRYVQCVQTTLSGKSFGDGITDAEADAAAKANEALSFLQGCFSVLVPIAGQNEVRIGDIHPPDCTIIFTTFGIGTSPQSGYYWNWERSFNDGSLEFDFSWNVTAIKCRQSVPSATPICLQDQAVVPIHHPAAEPCEATIEAVSAGFKIIDMPGFLGGFIPFRIFPPFTRGGSSIRSLWFPDSANVQFTCCNFAP